MGKDFHAAFSNMNKAVRPGVGQSAVGQPGITQSGVAQPGVVQPVGETKIKTKKKCEDILREALVQYMNVYK